jgi:hypothetical protein
LLARRKRSAIDGVATLSDGRRVLLARVRGAPEDGKANQIPVTPAYFPICSRE